MGRHRNASAKNIMNNIFLHSAIPDTSSSGLTPLPPLRKYRIRTRNHMSIYPVTIRIPIDIIVNIE